MRGFGIHCHIRDGRPIVVGVIVEGAVAEPDAREVFRHIAQHQADQALQLTDIDRDFSSRLPDIAPDAVVVKLADFHRSRPGAIRRAQAEGVVLGAARRSVELTQGLGGAEIGRLLGEPKSKVMARASELLPDGDKEACAAGLAALTLATNT